MASRVSSSASLALSCESGTAIIRFFHRIKTIMTAEHASSGACLTHGSGAMLYADDRAPRPNLHSSGQDEPPGDKTYTAKIILTRGDAYPFQIAVPISVDGHYEFKAIPAGRYQISPATLGRASKQTETLTISTCMSNGES